MPNAMHRPSSGNHGPNPAGIIFMLFMLFWMLFWAGSVSCFLFASHRIAKGLDMAGRAQALQAAGDAMTDEEKRTATEILRRQVTHRY